MSPKKNKKKISVPTPISAKAAKLLAKDIKDALKATGIGEAEAASLLAKLDSISTPKIVAPSLPSPQAQYQKDTLDDMLNYLFQFKPRSAAKEPNCLATVSVNVFCASCGKHHTLHYGKN